MRNPNGYGSIYKLSGNRRRPWCVRITTDWTDEGEQIKKIIGYYATRPEAIKALADYNDSPYDIDKMKITFAELYIKAIEPKFEKVSRSSTNGYKMAYKESASLHDMRFVDIKAAQLQKVIDTCKSGHGTLRKIKVLFNQLFKYAMANDVVTKDYSKFVDIGQNEEESTRAPFSASEIQLLWENIDRLDYIDTVLIMIYSGMRPGELVKIETAKINLGERIMRGGIKTTAGKNRVIPINKKILPFIEARVDEDNRYLVINDNKESMSYYTYYQSHFKRVMEQLQLDHKPHDCRHTFATLMDNAGANKVATQRIMGHASKDITDKVYTHKDIDELLKAIDMI